MCANQIAVGRAGFIEPAKSGFFSTRTTLCEKYCKRPGACLTDEFVRLIMLQALQSIAVKMLAARAREHEFVVISPVHCVMGHM